MIAMMERNNTNFSKDIREKVEEYDEKSPEYLKQFVKDYQLIPFNYIMEKNVRGLLVFHGTGTGKTLTAVTIAEQFRKYNRDIIVISPKSLQANFKKELRFFNKRLRRGISDEEIESITNQYKFVTSNASNMIEQLKDVSSIENILSQVNTVNLNNKIIIVDEAHNLFNSIVNGSSNANEFYDIVMNTRNIKIVFLTATPIVNNVFEIVPALNMCAGKIYESGESRRGGMTILPESYDDFSKYFIDEENIKIKNKDKLRNRIMGLISYTGDLFNIKQNEFHNDILEPKVRPNFPTQLPLIIEKIKMSELQCADYEIAREKERMEVDRKSGGGFQKMMEKKSSSYRIHSRQISNIYMPENELEKVDVSQLEIYSPKIKKMIENIQKHENQLGMIYSSFIKYGITAVSYVLNFHGYELIDMNTFDIQKDEPKKRYAIYTGDIKPETRAEIIRLYNNKNNENGKYLQLLLISSSGAEGVSLRSCRHVHIMEPYWNYERIVQVSARAIRYMSHQSLPEEEQNVQVYLYLSIFPDAFLKIKKKEVDERIVMARAENRKLSKEQRTVDPPTEIHLFKNSIRKKEINDEMLRLLASVSIECNKKNNRINFECYECKPTNRRLFQADLDVDMLIPSPCMMEKQIQVHEVLINKIPYYYEKKENGSIRVYKEDQDDEYIEVHDEEIIKKIQKSMEHTS